MGDEEDPAQAWSQVCEAMREITADDDAMAMEVDGPAGKMPATEIIGKFVTMDVLVHTWDLARRVGRASGCRKIECVKPTKP